MKRRHKFPPKTTSNYRSGLEEQIVQQLKASKIDFGYEEKDKIEILDQLGFKDSLNYENSLISLNNAFTNKYYKIVILVI